MSDMITKLKEALLRQEENSYCDFKPIIGPKTAIELVRRHGPLHEQYLICGEIDVVELEKALNEWKAKNET